MAITQNTFTGNGSNLGPFSFTFKWLEPTDIKVTVAGTLKTAGTHYNLQSLNYSTKTGGQVLFTAGNAPANGAAIVIYRQTDDTDLVATFNSGSAIRAQDLNDNFIQGIYVTQEANNNVVTANATANAATATANTALSNSSAAVSTANTASSNATAAVTTANTASSNASAAVSTANTASSNATSAVNTANAATATANSASSTAATALSTANAATSTANSASTAATNAVNTANAASATASSAVSTANTASSNASAAVATANTASSNASTALSTANSALSTANAAASAVANAILYDIVANVAAIPGTPANNDAVEVTNSTGIESFTPLTGLPAGFVGSSGLSVRLVYTTTGNTWTWIQYFPNDPESRYLKLSGGTLTGQLKVDDSTSVASPVIAFDGDTNTGIAHTGADELALVTGGSARVTIDSSGAVNVTNGLSVNSQTVVVDTDARLTNTRTPTDGTVTNDKVSASAAISGTKISPDFGAQNVTTTGTSTAASFIPSSSTVPTNGVYLPAANSVAISTNGTRRFQVSSDGTINVFGANKTPSGGGNSVIYATDTQAVDVGGSIAFGGYYIGTSSDTEWAQIAGRKENSTSGNYAGYLQFSTRANGGSTTERLRITSAGLVGIGTSSPGQTVTVQSSASGTAPTLKLQNPVNSNSSQGAATGLSAGQLLFGATGAFPLTAKIESKYDPIDASFGRAAKLVISSADYTGGLTDAVTVVGGSVGIGTTPSQLLHLSGAGFPTIRVTDADNGTYFDITNSDGDIILKADEGNTFANSAIRFMVDGGEKFRCDSSGRLLVGTSSATNHIRADQKLAVVSVGTGNYGGASLTTYSGTTAAAAPIFELQRSRGTSDGSFTKVESGDSLGLLIFRGATGSTWHDGASIEAVVDGATSNADIPSRLVFSVSQDGSASPTERLRIGNSGFTNLFVTASDGFQSRNSSAAGTSAACFAARHSATGTTDGTLSFVVWTNGNVQNTNNSYTAISDIKLKENIVDANSQWDDIKALQVRNYSLKEGQTHKQIGLIAQEVEPISPGLVYESPDRDAEGNDLGTTTKSVNYSVLYMKAVKALQEAMERIETLEAKVAALESA